MSIAFQAALKEPIIKDCLAPLIALARSFSKNRSAWKRFKKTQLKILKWVEERSDDERDANYDGDEDFNVGGEWQPHLKKVLGLLRPMPIHWNSINYTIKRVLTLKDSLMMSIN